MHAVLEIQLMQLEMAELQLAQVLLELTAYCPDGQTQLEFVKRNPAKQLSHVVFVHDEQYENLVVHIMQLLLLASR